MRGGIHDVEAVWWEEGRWECKARYLHGALVILCPTFGATIVSGAFTSFYSITNRDRYPDIFCSCFGLRASVGSPSLITMNALSEVDSIDSLNARRILLWPCVPRGVFRDRGGGCPPPRAANRSSRHQTRQRVDRGGGRSAAVRFWTGEEPPAEPKRPCGTAPRLPRQGERGHQATWCRSRHAVRR